MGLYWAPDTSAAINYCVAGTGKYPCCGIFALHSHCMLLSRLAESLHAWVLRN